LDQLEHHYQALTTNTVNVPDFICVMTLLSTIPPQWETFVTPRLLQGQNITTVMYQAVKEAVLLQWDTQQVQKVAKSGTACVQKISNIPRKG
jgi:hypothetical protein